MLPPIQTQAFSESICASPERAGTQVAHQQWMLLEELANRITSRDPLEAHVEVPGAFLCQQPQ